MGITDIIAIIVIALLVGGAVFYIARSKKQGKKCIGCPYCDSCSAKQKNSCGAPKK